MITPLAADPRADVRKHNVPAIVDQVDPVIDDDPGKAQRRAIRLRAGFAKKCVHRIREPTKLDSLALPDFRKPQPAAFRIRQREPHIRAADIANKDRFTRHAATLASRAARGKAASIGAFTRTT